MSGDGKGGKGLGKGALSATGRCSMITSRVSQSQPSVILPAEVVSSISLLWSTRRSMVYWRFSWRRGRQWQLWMLSIPSSTRDVPFTDSAVKLYQLLQAQQNSVLSGPLDPPKEKNSLKSCYCSLFLWSFLSAPTHPPKVKYSVSQLLLLDREGYGHKAVLYKSHFPPLRHSVHQLLERHHCIHRLINHVYNKDQTTFVIHCPMTWWQLR